MLRSSVTRKLSGSAAVETGSAALASVAASTLPGAPTARPIAARCASESGASIAIAGSLDRTSRLKAGGVPHQPVQRKNRWVPTAVTLSRSEEHTSELQSLMRISYAVFCLNKQTTQEQTINVNNK